MQTVELDLLDLDPFDLVDDEPETVADLRERARTAGIKVPRGARKADLAKLLEDRDSGSVSKAVKAAEKLTQSTGRPAPNPDNVSFRLVDTDQTTEAAESAAFGRWLEANNELKNYWTKGEGLAKWADHAHPWTALFRHLRKHLGSARAKRVAAQWFHDVKGYWPGHQRGKNPVGPG
jgi:hypothetical protein